MSRRKPMSVYIPIAPRVKERPRMTRRGRVFTPERTLAAEAAIAAAWKRKFPRRKPLEGPVRMEVHFDKKGQLVTITPIEDKTVLRGDLDNYVKLIGDALNGVAFLDDRQISEIYSSSTGTYPQGE